MSKAYQVTFKVCNSRNVIICLKPSNCKNKHSDMSLSWLIF